MASCATRTSFAGHPSIAAKADDELTFKLDHLMGSGHIHAWHLALLHAEVPALIAKWERRLGVEVEGYFLQRMKTKWGSCNPKRGTIRLNAELVKKPRDMLEYVIVHEMIHLIEPKHTKTFFELLDRYLPGWSVVRAELNQLPLSAES